MSQAKQLSLSLCSQMAGSSNVLLSASARIKDYEYLYASDTNVSAFVSVKLSGSRNYPLWKAQMLCLLDSKNMCGIVDAAFVGPKDSGTGITRRYDSLVRGWIFGSVTEDVLGDVFNLGSAKAVWEKLKSIHDHTVCSPEVGDTKKMEWFILWDEIDKLKSSHIHHPYFSRSQLYCQRLLKVEKWVKDIAESCSITTALITAIVFAAGITVPDVSNREMRTSFFEKETLFIIFGISDAISLFTSTMALLVFLCILTARFDEKDFLVGLPRRLFIGLFFLLLSTTAMMVASSATFFLVFCDQKPWMLAPICGLAFILIAFVTLQFPVIVDLFRTYLGIFGKHRKNHTGRDFKSSNILHEATFTQGIKEDGSTILHMTADAGKKMGNSSNPLQSGSARIQDIEYLYASNTKVSSFVSVKLSGSCNYLLWKAQMIYLLDSKNLSGVVDSAFGGPRDSGTETMRQYNSLVKGWIFGSVSEDVLVDVFHLSSAKAVWEKLKFIYEPTLGLPKVGNIKKKEWSTVPMSHRDNLCDENKTAETGSNENDVGNYDLFNDDDDVDEDELLFGASRSIRLDHKHVTTLIQGTIGYMNPEYFHISQPNVKSDVYSFGVVLFEIITRKKPIHVDRTTSEKNLSAYFVNSLKENPEELQEEEVIFLGKFSHPNLVNRVRYCWEDRKFLLVNEYRQKGSFENHLFRSPKPVPWSTRIKIAIEAAQALAFLHTPKETAIYRDLKSSNILLDRDFNVKLSDFGLSKLGIAKTFPTGEIFLLFGHIKKRKEWDDAKMVLEMVCDEIKQVGQLWYSSSLLHRPILEAACQNTMQVVYEILTRSHEAIQSEDKKGYDIIQLTKVRHSKKVYNFIYDIVDCKNLYRTVKDSSKNNIVHMV